MLASTLSKRLRVLLTVLVAVGGLSLWLILPNGMEAQPPREGRVSLSMPGSAGSTTSMRSGKPEVRQSTNPLQATFQYKQLLDARLILIADRAGFESQPEDGKRNRWSVISPQQAPIISPAPAVSVAPPFPYQYIGRLEGFDRPIVQTAVQNAVSVPAKGGSIHSNESLTGGANPGLAIIVKADRTWVLGENEVLEGQWKIISIGANQLKVQYVALGLEQIIAMKKS